MKKNTLRHHILSILLASTTLSLPVLSSADTWNTWTFDNINTSNKYTIEPHFFYVGKGSEWQSIRFSSEYSTEHFTTLLVKYDDKLIYNTTLNGAGELSFNIPASESGFHRLDFILQQYSPPTSPAADRTTFCSEDVDQVTYLTNSKMDYLRHRPVYKLKDLPDALFNPQIVRPTPFVGVLKFNSANMAEATMLGRLINAWTPVTPIRWYEQSEPADQAANFFIEISRSATPLPNGTLVEISAQNEIPTLRIQYDQPEKLASAINGLLNPEYLKQLDTSATFLPNKLAAPNWAKLKQIKTLADLGIEDFRLNQADKNLFLNFPAVWQPTDILQGQIALRVQSGLLEGSNITTWIDGGLAGSLKTAELESDPVNRQFNYFAKTISDNTTFSMKLENSVIVNSQCLPTAKGSLWIDTKKSTVKLPHKIKNGVASLSMSFATHPTIAIDGNPGSLEMAIAISQAAKKMLMTNDPVPLNLVKFDSSKPEVLNIRVNPNIYRQQILMHPDIIYAPAAARGFLVNVHNQRFDVITDSVEGAQNFTRLWDKVQPNIPNNVSKILVAENGQIFALQKIIIGNQKAPLVQQSSFFILIVIISAIMIVAILLWYWRKRPHDQKKAD
ncbi:hypothetical protein QLH32_06110 [Acinetobacter corruptisaponis]|uniref:Cellulose biosynthesis cyclic di-GMP-binding regulatory protein BcsB n=1 Tax=Acinetobacter corruptisaponis TaxID=3045147 RepID=A0ABY8S9C2_9GAMM|nr:hypothetical protein [Acinetobacter sp. KCTC 92772]WHP07034.1 hypothetical protein QLH32_06110 [Acinetobacter sp. KCTC 92772]